MTNVQPPGDAPRARLNLSEWALEHRSLVRYLIVVLAAMGAWAYTHLGQSEDPRSRSRSWS